MSQKRLRFPNMRRAACADKIVVMSSLPGRVRSHPVRRCGEMDASLRNEAQRARNRMGPPKCSTLDNPGDAHRRCWCHGTCRCPREHRRQQPQNLAATRLAKICLRATPSTHGSDEAGTVARRTRSPRAMPTNNDATADGEHMSPRQGAGDAQVAR